jgi:hypothetical protein
MFLPHRKHTNEASRLVVGIALLFTLQIDTEKKENGTNYTEE